MREIHLTQGKIAIVDDADHEYLSQFHWVTHKKRGTYYALRATKRPDGKKTLIYMHREILGMADPKVFVDHIDHDGLNNSRGNLRTCTHRENKRNIGKLRTNTSGYKGVSWHKERRRWCSAIKVNGKNISLGGFKSKDDAARAYNVAAIKYFGEFAYVNVIESDLSMVKDAAAQLIQTERQPA